jgi:hypothetical protein
VLCILVEIDCRFRDTYFLHHQSGDGYSKYSRNVVVIFNLAITSNLASFCLNSVRLYFPECELHINENRRSVKFEACGFYIHVLQPFVPLRHFIS